MISQMQFSNVRGPACLCIVEMMTSYDNISDGMSQSTSSITLDYSRDLGSFGTL